jgi:hypothetical protein
MILTFVDDYSSDIILDTQLTGDPESGMYFNRGVHPLITIGNIIQFMSNHTITFDAYAAGTTYGKYMTTRLKSDIVTSGAVIYQSLLSANTANTPASSPTYWVPTNIQSVKIKTEIFKAEDSLKQALGLTRKLVENQYIYNVGRNEVDLQGDFNGWAFEPKGSDYVKIRINQISLQAMTTDDVSLYVINQGVLLETLTLHPNNGILSFEDVPYTISGKGVFYFVFASQTVLSNNAYNDPLKYTGFVCYPVQGIGSTAATADYKEATPNGLNFNVSVYTDTSAYVTNNLIDFAKALQSQFELNMLKLFYHNPHIQLNNNVRNASESQVNSALYNEIMGIEGETVVRKYNRDIKEAKEALNRTYDKFAKSDSNTFTIKVSTI